MSLNILTADGLQRIGGVTKEEIITALEYTPANSEVESTVGTHIADDDSHISAEERISWNAKSDFSGSFHDLDGAPDIVDDGFGELHIADGSGNIIARVDAGGIHTTEIEVGGVVLGQAVSGHIGDSNIHISEEERVAWNSRSDFSGAYEDLTGKPNISEDGSAGLAITDQAGNIIAQFDSGGLKTTAVSANSIIVGGIDVMPVVDEHISSTAIHVSEEDRVAWNNKVDKEAGKGLSSNDFTDEEKAKLALISDDITAAGIDDALSDTSTNPVQNRVVNAAIKSINDITQDHIGNVVKHITAEERASWNNKSNFSGVYQDLTGKPNISEDESGELVVTDMSGNVILRIDESGLHSVGLMLNGDNIYDIISNAAEDAVRKLQYVGGGEDNAELGSITICIEAENNVVPTGAESFSVNMYKSDVKLQTFNMNIQDYNEVKLIDVPFGDYFFDVTGAEIEGYELKTRYMVQYGEGETATNQGITLTKENPNATIIISNKYVDQRGRLSVRVSFEDDVVPAGVGTFAINVTTPTGTTQTIRLTKQYPETTLIKLPLGEYYIEEQINKIQVDDYNLTTRYTVNYNGEDPVESQTITLTEEKPEGYVTVINSYKVIE